MIGKLSLLVLRLYNYEFNVELLIGIAPELEESSTAWSAEKIMSALAAVGTRAVVTLLLAQPRLKHDRVREFDVAIGRVVVRGPLRGAGCTECVRVATSLG
eukprot:COSAG03_NODE_876_length_5528_cov_8.710260_3_plen_101_part_00